MFIPSIQNNYINSEFRPQNAIEESLQELIRISTQAITKNGRLDLAVVVQALKQAMELSENNPSQEQAIKEAVEQIEKLLLENKMLLEKKGYSYQSLLYQLIDERQVDIAKRIIELDISTIHSQTTPEQSTPLHLSCYQGELELVRALIEHGADCNALDVTFAFKLDQFNGNSPLGKCVQGARKNFLKKRESYDAIIEYLLSHGADPKIGHILQSPILNECINFGFEDWAWKLIDKADLNACDPVVSRRPIHLSISMRMVKLTKELLRRGVDVHALCLEGLFKSRKLAPLHLAVIRKNSEIVAALMEAGANPNQKAENVYFGTTHSSDLSKPEPLTPFMMAVDLNAKNCLDIIVKNAKEPLDTNFPGARNYLNASLEEITRKGYESIDIRIKTEVMKRKYHIDNISPFRCASADPALIATIQSIFQNSIYGSIESLHAIRDIYHPLFKILAQECLTNPNFWICFLKQEDIPGLGCYNRDTGDELTLSTDLNSKAKILPILIHEITHKVADLIYGHSAPSPTSQFHQALQEDLVYLEKTHYQGCNQVVRFILNEIKEYPKSNHPAEYLARIPQAATILAIHHPEYNAKMIEDIMMASIPNLYHFFIKDFIPASQNYLAKVSSPEIQIKI